MKVSLIHLVLLTSMLSCIEPFEIGSVDYSRVLVVDGLLTNEEKAHKVRLSYTYPVNTQDSEPDPATQAEVWIADQDENIFRLGEVHAGEYETSKDFQGVPGNTYVLHIRLQDGQEYISSPEVLIPSPAIDKLYGEYKQKTNVEGEIENGVQLFLDTNDINDTINHFRYEWEETYRVSVPFPSKWAFFDFSTDPVNPRVVFERREEPLDTCYVQSVSEIIQLKSISGQSGHRIEEFPLRFLNETTRHLSERYFISVRQYAISTKTSAFYKQLKENRERTGSLFDKQPGRIPGNVRSVVDPELVVQGYFEVSGVAEIQQYFIPQTFYESGLPRFEWDFSRCTSGDTTKNGIVLYLRAYPDHLITEIVDDEVYLIDEVCSDCRFYGGGTMKRPEFWVD